MNEEMLSLQDVLAIIRRHRLPVIALILCCTALGYAATLVMSKKFKSTAQLNLQATYFDVPLMNDSIVGTRDGAEMQSQKQALLRLALSDEFLDKEGEKYHLFKQPVGSSDRIIERDILRKNIDYFSSTATTFQISTIGKTADIAFGLATDVLDQFIAVLVSERQKNIMTYRESLRKELETLGISVSATAAPSAGSQPQVLQQELSNLEDQESALEAQYTANHPKVAAIRERITAVKQMLERSELQAKEHPSATKPGFAIDPKKAGQRSEFAEELLKKINYLDIALELEANHQSLPYLEILEHPVMPTGFFYPKTNFFILGGLMAGVLLSLLLVGLSELKRASMVTPQTAAAQLGIPYLGALPVMIKTVVSFETPTERGTRG